MATDKIQSGSIIKSSSGKLYVVTAVYGHTSKGYRLGVYRWEDGQRVGGHRNLYSDRVQVVHSEPSPR